MCQARRPQPPPESPPPSPPSEAEQASVQEQWLQLAASGEEVQLTQLLWAHLETPLLQLGERWADLGAHPLPTADVIRVTLTAVVLGFTHRIDHWRRWLVCQAPVMWQALLTVLVALLGGEISGEQEGLWDYLAYLTADLTWEQPLTTGLLAVNPLWLISSPQADHLYATATPAQRQVLSSTYQVLGPDVVPIPSDWCPEDPVQLWSYSWADLYRQPEAHLLRAAEHALLRPPEDRHATARGFMVCTLRGLDTAAGRMVARDPGIAVALVNDGGWVAALATVSRQWPEPTPEWVEQWPMTITDHPQQTAVDPQHLDELYHHWPRIAVILAARSGHAARLEAVALRTLVEGRQHVLPILLQEAGTWLGTGDHLRQCLMHALRRGQCYALLETAARERWPDLWAAWSTDLGAALQGQREWSTTVPDYHSPSLTLTPWNALLYGDQVTRAQYPDHYQRPEVIQAQADLYCHPDLRQPALSTLVPRLAETQGVAWLYEHCQVDAWYRTRVAAGQDPLCLLLEEYCGQHPEAIDLRHGAWFSGMILHVPQDGIPALCSVAPINHLLAKHPEIDLSSAIILSVRGSEAVAVHVHRSLRELFNRESGREWP